MKQMKYTIVDFRSDFPDDDTCLEWLKNYLYPEGIFCPNDKKVTPHHKLKKRKAYSCELCGHHTYPTANTIFHKSSTPLTLWFYAVYLMAATRAGISAKQLERELGVTYKTAWRMFHQIRKMMAADDDKFTDGEVEVDETYVGAKVTSRSTVKPNSQQPVFCIVQRGGKAKAIKVDKVGTHLLPIIKENVDLKVKVYSDQYQAYKTLYWMGYSHSSVHHANKEYVRGKVHTQNIDNLWSNMKRGIKGVYRHVDPKYLQAYADEYAFRYSHRKDFQPMFWALLNRLSK